MSHNGDRPIVMIGGGGHASVLTDILLQQERKIIAVISPEDVGQKSIFSGMDHFKKDEDVLRYSTQEVRLVNGIGMMPRSLLRRKINEYFLDLGYEFATVISDRAYISPYAKIGEGVQIFPSAIVNTGAEVGQHTIVNTGALIEHDCRIGEYNHIAPRASLCGQVMTEQDVYIGAGAVVIQSISIGRGTIVGAGVNLTESIEPNTIAYPPKIFKRAYLHNPKGKS